MSSFLHARSTMLFSLLFFFFFLDEIIFFAFTCMDNVVDV